MALVGEVSMRYERERERERLGLMHAAGGLGVPILVDGRSLRVVREGDCLDMRL